jgi:hypothetical protein
LVFENANQLAFVSDVCFVLVVAYFTEKSCERILRDMIVCHFGHFFSPIEPFSYAVDVHQANAAITFAKTHDGIAFFCFA